MLQKSKLFTNKLSTKISLKVVSLVAALLAVALFAMLHFSRKTVREEAILKAEQTLDGTVEHIDEVLLSVEQSTGNMYYNMYSHLDNPEMMYVYCRRLIESNPYISGCAIAFEPYYYRIVESCLWHIVIVLQQVLLLCVLRLLEINLITSRSGTPSR